MGLELKVLRLLILPPFIKRSIPLNLVELQTFSYPSLLFVLYL